MPWDSFLRAGSWWGRRHRATPAVWSLFVKTCMQIQLFRALCNRGYSLRGRLPAMASGHWALLAYRLPREPSTPRIALWRALRRLGVGQIVDGLVALPADARTREQLEWLAEAVTQAGGEASVWLAQPGSA